MFRNILVFVTELKIWSLTSLFQHKYGCIREEKPRVESYPYPVKEGQRCINLNSDSLFVQQPPKKGNGSSLKLLRQRLQQKETIITPQDKTKSNTAKRARILGLT